ncbi:hypothetical protein [Candidatus Methanoperedens nitratireducens]|uniref:Uncharacterized protein n=1 Tax=Candidatus Methanoperedens nitratireducens TaxID=1392998 RepID=A0A284VTB1_9EURY|nr:hypothetical protein [Candidatus Methanoperedens nitroreducens]SNQ62427.1 hypothetical protein MNV_710003 [Candidatus Methanoperedens nitroreducens]
MKKSDFFNRLQEEGKLQLVPPSEEIMYYLKNSLEGILKEKAKKESKKITDTKTAPHIADLLILAGLAELGYTKSSGNGKIQGIRSKADLK